MKECAAAVLERITQLALKQFVAALCENRDYEWNPAHGEPPSRAYVEQKEFVTEPWTAKKTFAAWAIANYETVTEIEPITKWDKPIVNGMFFDRLVGYWGLSEDHKRISINWQTGPRFGRGFIQPILESPSGVLYLGDRKPIWIS